MTPCSPFHSSPRSGMSQFNRSQLTAKLRYSLGCIQVLRVDKVCMEAGADRRRRQGFAGLMTLRSERGFRCLSAILKRPRKTKQDFWVNSESAKRWMLPACSVPRHPTTCLFCSILGRCRCWMQVLGPAFLCVHHRAVLDSTGEGARAQHMQCGPGDQ